MASVLIGEGAITLLSEMSRILRERTRKMAEDLDHREYPRYTPWLCLRPILDRPFEDAELTTSVPKTDGELIVDPKALNRIRRFLRGQGHRIVEHLPVKPDQWPIMEDIATKRPDAVAAFDEGRALVRQCKFLDILYPYLVSCVVPQRRERPSGFDSAFARGAVFRTFPRGRGGLLAGFQIAHAMGHQAAILLQSADPIIEPRDRDKIIHYAVRRDKRTADHAFVSAAALAYMVILSQSMYGPNARPYIADDHVRGYDDYLPDALAKAVRSIRGNAKLTSAGTVVLDNLESLATAA